MIRWILLSLVVGLAAPVGGAVAADFTMTDTNGVKHELKQYRGRWVLVNFWATWCGPCIDEIPELSALYDAHKDSGLVVLGVALEYADAQGVIDFADTHMMSYPLVLGSDKIAGQIGKVKALPATYLYSPAGKLALHRLGPVTREMIEEIIGAPPAKQRSTLLQRPLGD